MQKRQIQQTKPVDHPYIFLLHLVTLLFLLFGCTPRYNKQALKRISIGQNVSELYSQVGKPLSSQQLEKWSYEQNAFVLIENKVVFDFVTPKRFSDRKTKFIKKRKDITPSDKWSKVKIGLKEQELVALLGEPEEKKATELLYYKKHEQVFVESGTIVSINLRAHATMEKFDRIRLNFNTAGVNIINIALALIMFGIALELKVVHFVRVLKRPKSFLIGVASQFVALPLLTFLLVVAVQPTPSVAMGMILVAACPGGNISNYMSSISRANTALSISLTSFATLITIFMTPLNFTMWGSLYAGTADAVVPIRIDMWEMVRTVLLILGIPVIAGISFANAFPKYAPLLSKYIKKFAMLFFIGLVLGALVTNFNFFLDYIHLVVLLVFVHNLLALLTGYYLGTLFKVPFPDRRTLTIETGIQNSGLGLVLIFNPNLFDGLGGMAFITAWWGIWHIISGLTLSFFWKNKLVKRMTRFPRF